MLPEIPEFSAIRGMTVHLKNSLMCKTDCNMLETKTLNNYSVFPASRVVGVPRKLTWPGQKQSTKIQIMYVK